MSQKIADIQVLRAFAIIFVFAQHIKATIPSRVMGYLPEKLAFWTGVELFLVISGFVITRALIKRGDFKTWNTAGFLEFWIRRFRRLFPASSFWLAVSLVVSLFIGLSTHDIWGNVKGALMVLTATYNLFEGYCTIYLAYGTVCPSNSITRIYWSLSLEEQFYLLLSLSLLLGHPRKIMVAGITVAFGFLALRWYFSDSYIIAAIHRVTDRSYGLFFGVALALGYRCYEPFVSKIPGIVRGVFIALASCSIIFLPGFVGPATPLAAAMLSTLVVAVATVDATVSRGPLGRILVWLGERSYSLYLCHFSFLYITGHLIRIVTASEPTQNTSMALSAAAIAASFCLSTIAAHLTYEFIEKRYIGGPKTSRAIDGLQSTK